MTTDRVIPQNVEAEEAVLGAMMLSPKAIDKVSDILDDADFFRESHARIYRVMLGLHGAGDPVDAITVTDELERRGELEDVGGRVRIHELAALVPSSVNVGHYAQIVREMATLRGLVHAGDEIARLGWEHRGEVRDLITQAEAYVLELTPRGERRETLYSSKDVVALFREKMANPVDDSVGGIPTPWSFIRPLKGGRLYVLAAYTADGKTATATQFLRAACEAGKRVDFASIEMSVADLADRLVSTFGVPHFMCQSGMVSEQYREGAEHALRLIEGWDFYIKDDETIDVAELRRHVRMRRPDMLIIDHLHRMEWKERRDLELAIRALTNIAREFDLPIVLLAQLNRSPDWKDPFPRPTLTRLRETAVLEQEAFAVWFVWRKRDEFQQPGTEAEFIIAKNRGGPLGWQRMEFVPSEVRFRPVGTPGMVA